MMLKEKKKKTFELVLILNVVKGLTFFIQR